MPRIRITNAELLDNAKSQIAKMKHYCELFDEGQEMYISEIALKIRVLLHTTGASKSLYDELLECYGMSKVRFPDSRGLSTLHDPAEGNYNYLSSKMYEVECKVESDSCTYSIKYKSNVRYTFWSFDDWWSNSTVMFWGTTILTRRDIVSLIANQIGGAHTDKEIDEKIYNLKERLVAQTRISLNGNKFSINSKDVLFALLRTISNEVIYVFEKKIFPQFR